MTSETLIDSHVSKNLKISKMKQARYQETENAIKAHLEMLWSLILSVPGFKNILITLTQHYTLLDS